jgi:hypothetical protein
MPVSRGHKWCGCLTSPLLDLEQESRRRLWSSSVRGERGRAAVAAKLSKVRSALLVAGAAVLDKSEVGIRCQAPAVDFNESGTAHRPPPATSNSQTARMIAAPAEAVLIGYRMRSTFLGRGAKLQRRLGINLSKSRFAAIRSAAPKPSVN